MADPSTRPLLRPVESIVVPDPQYGRLLVLRDTQGITEAHASIPPPLVPIVARFDGTMTCVQIALDAGRELGVDIPVEVVVRLANELDRAFFLDTPAYRAERQRIVSAFTKATLRPASHAGGAYHDNPRKLARYLDEACLAAAKRLRNGEARNGRGAMVGLVAPHIDPWRGAIGYGHAYGCLAEAIAPDVDTFIIFGTSHAPMREAFALCDKAFDTPLGPVPADQEAIDHIAKHAPFDPFADLFNHKREHSLEFQVVFLKHVLGERPFRIVPVLAGLGEHQARGTHPEDDDRANRFLDAVRELVESRAGRVVVVAGADLAHVGPRFGDPAPFGPSERLDLERTDRASLAHALDRDDRSFWSHVAQDLETRRVCGLAPIYALLRTLPGNAKGELLHYEQTIDSDDGSIVSHAAVGYFA